MEEDKNINDEAIRTFLGKSEGSDFKVPENYFEGFQKNVYSKILDNKNQWWKLPQVKMTLVGTLSVFLVVIVLIDFSKSISVAEVDMSEQELLAYYADNIDEISESEILEIMTEDDLNSISEGLIDSTYKKKEEVREEKKEIPSLDDFTDEEIYEYMLDEGYDDGDWDNL